MIPCPMCEANSRVGLKQRGKTKHTSGGRYTRVYRCGDCGIEQVMNGGPYPEMPTYQVRAPSDAALH